MQVLGGVNRVCKFNINIPDDTMIFLIQRFQDNEAPRSPAGQDLCSATTPFGGISVSLQKAAGDQSEIAP